MRKYNWSSSLIIVRYLIILCLITLHVYYRSESDQLHFVLLLIYISLNQIRFFLIKSRRMLWASFLLEAALIYILFLPGFQIFVVYFMLSVFDTLLFSEKWQFMLVNGLFAAELLILYRSMPFPYLLVNLLLGSAFFLFLSEILKERERAANAQYLYDELREKEEQLKELNKELEQYAGTVETMTLLRERNRISRELHDNIGHRLSTSVVQLGAIEKILSRDPDKAAEMVSFLREYHQESLQTVRSVVNELKAEQDGSYEGLLSIEQLILNFRKLTGVEVNMDIRKTGTEVWPLSQEELHALYRIIQESLSNSLRHGKASVIRVLFHYQPQQLTVTAQDNGCGHQNPEEGNGLNNMRTRIRELDGDLQYKTAEKQGFLLVIQLPKRTLSDKTH